MEDQTLPWLIVIFAGLFSLAGGVLNWDFFMNNYRAKLFVSVLGRQGARVVYVLLGLGLAGFGAFQLLSESY